MWLTLGVAALSRIHIYDITLGHPCQFTRDPHFTDEEAEAQRGGVTCSRTHKEQAALGSTGAQGGRPGAYLDVLLQPTDELPVHLARLRGSETAALGLAQPILQDAAGLAGLVQLLPQLLQLVHILLHVDVPHLQHLGPKLLDLVLQGDGAVRSPPSPVAVA